MSDTTPETPAAGPWADDIRAALGEEHAGAFDVFDSYMRENVQPRMTQLEQDLAPARELWTDLQNDTDQAIFDMVAARYGDEFATSYRGLFPGEEEATTPASASTETTTPPSALGEEDQELLAWAREKRDSEQKQARQSEYETFKQELGKKHSLSENDVKLLDPFIYASPDDPDAAVEAYRAWRTEAGVTAPQPEPVPEPPAVLGSEAAPAATPPTATQYTKFDQLGDALGDWLTTQRPASDPPPVVG